jgi:hypothetical protein
MGVSNWPEFCPLAGSMTAGLAAFAAWAICERVGAAAVRHAAMGYLGSRSK